MRSSLIGSSRGGVGAPTASGLKKLRGSFMSHSLEQSRFGLKVFRFDTWSSPKVCNLPGSCDNRDATLRYGMSANRLRQAAFAGRRVDNAATSKLLTQI